ncbi:MAG: ABC transporter permease subunit [Ardenticatenaceae bacterium]|nr:ABC transporter permease subunit [Anaerolineales bacterium]MCB8920583.1 ABC transporter permease subunit [Ardenticatenaceae bacterium]MCB8990207.1 ABC transporter permease subunit [Ardenticatenaceae bacterium]MCB9003001.1 ABC transporter permease subunit [Ardenticatenaceae bacterium]
MNIFLRELKANRKSLLIWSGITILFVIIGFSKFSAYEGNPELLAILDEFPTPVIEALSLKAFNLTTVTGFFGVMFSYFALLLSISAAMWGSDIISKEERDKTVEFSLTLPVTRGRLITAKALSALVNSIVLLFVTWGAILAGAANYETDSEFFSFVAISMLALFIMQLVFLAVGLFLGCAMSQYKRSASVAVSLLLGTYFLSIISGLNKNLEFLKYFSPFKYFNPATLLHESKVDMLYVGLSAAIVVVAMVGAYLSYSKRDLYI